MAQTSTTTCPLPGSTAPGTTVDPNCVPADTSPAAVAANTDTSIVVTGSRIRRPNLESAVPITSVATQDLTNRGEVSLGDALNDLPSLRSTFSQANSTNSIGTAGLSILDLRGLGTNRTLVLVNGRRMVSAQPGNFNVDVNTIPVDLLDRVDVVTGGSSSFSTWLAANGYAALASGQTTQSEFAREYGAWLNYLVNTFAIGHDVNGDGHVDVGLNQNDSVGAPVVEGLTNTELDAMFGARISLDVVTGNTRTPSPSPTGRSTAATARTSSPTSTAPRATASRSPARATRASSWCAKRTSTATAASTR